MRIDLGTLRLGALLRGPIVISLEAGEFLRVEPGAAVEVRCQDGRLWITTENRGQTTFFSGCSDSETKNGVCPRFSGDVWLRNGESAVVDPIGLTLIEAVGLTRLSIARAAAS